MEPELPDVPEVPDVPVVPVVPVAPVVPEPPVDWPCGSFSWPPVPVPLVPVPAEPPPVPVPPSPEFPPFAAPPEVLVPGSPSRVTSTFRYAVSFDVFLSNAGWMPYTELTDTSPLVSWAVLPILRTKV